MIIVNITIWEGADGEIKSIVDYSPLQSETQRELAVGSEFVLAVRARCERDMPVIGLPKMVPSCRVKTS